MTMMLKLMTTAILSAAVAATPVAAQVVSLNFEGIAPYPTMNGDPTGNGVLIGGYYNGGTSSNGNSGTNYGVSFSSNAQLICLNSLTITCSNVSRGGLAPTSSQGGLLFGSGQNYVNYAAGFTTGFSLSYSAPSAPGSIGIYDGLNGTGNLLATLNFSLTPNGYNACPGYVALYCPFVPIGVNFSGTARSIGYDASRSFMVFDDVTFGSAIPGVSAVPEPATWAMTILGMGAVGYAMRRRRKVATRVIYAA